MNFKKIIPFILLFGLFYSSNSQIALYPTAIFIDPAMKTGSMQVLNTSNEVREVEVSIRFGYLAFDENGNPYTNFKDSIAESKYSLAPYIKVFPAKLIIPPNEQQVIRFLIRNMPTDKDQFYWTRIIASSVPQVPQVDTTDKTKISATIILKSEMIGLIGLLVGKNSSSLKFDYDGNSADSVNVNMFIKFDREGNSPFWGSLHSQLYDMEDNLIEERNDGLAIYFLCKQRFTFSKEKVKPGKYKLKLSVDNNRDEVPELYRGTAKSDSKTFDINVSY